MHKIFSQDANYLLNKLALPELENVRILITGSTGLIGSNILNFLNLLLLEGKFNFEVDALSMCPRENTIEFHERIHFQTGDLSLGVNEFELQKYDYIIHAATYGQPEKFVAQSLNTLTLNGPVVIELAKLLEANGTFLFLSTSEIYSGSTLSPNIESNLGNIPILSSRSAYVYGKIFGEVALLQHAEKYRVRIGRIALSYGPGTKLNDSRVLNQLIQRGNAKHMIELADAGDAVRTYCYIRDTVEMLLNVTFWGKSELYNVGGISKVTIRELGEEIAQIMKLPFHYPMIKKNYIDAPKHVELDISKYQNEFGRVEFMPLRDGLSRTIEWQKSELFEKVIP
jgi:dTDP-glucose 4,6-dehydratase/UDP-glucuronate decarboxylase